EEAAPWAMESCGVESYDEQQVSSLREGNLAGCFGPAFDRLDLSDPLRLPVGRMNLFDRVVELDPAGGRYGLGIIRAEADIQPDDWFLTCHFVDDMTMPGTLMYECCAHTLRFFLLRMGWIGERAEVTYQPIPGVSSALKCRGPVTPKTKTVIYEVEIKEIGYRPEPYVIANALMYADGKRVVEMTDMGVRMAGLSREWIEAVWARKKPCRQPIPPERTPATTPGETSKTTPLFDRDRILAFAIGRPSEAFGERYRVFDEERVIARLPGPPYQFIDRITRIESAEAWELRPGAWIEAAYDVPSDAWYFRANRQASMPFAVLLEVGLQGCGWLAAYLGSALQSETDLSFRNLDGRGTLHEEVFSDAGTLTTRVRLTDVSEAAGMIIEHFDFTVMRAGRVVYEGQTVFGFFSKLALAQQVGIRGAGERAYEPHEREQARAIRFELPDLRPYTPMESDSSSHDRMDEGSTDMAGAMLPGRAFRMIDSIDALVLDGGPHGLGFVRGSTRVDPAAWYFRAHFHQDPVWPGSLGLESLLQLLKVFAEERWGEQMARTHRFEPIALGTEHSWSYRGQILPTNKQVDVEAVITHIEDGRSPGITANGFLRVDGKIIYEMRDFGMRLVELGR
ncbi:MAG: type I polyketide synthase, partial [Phycisphaerae bacterium]